MSLKSKIAGRSLAPIAVTIEGVDEADLSDMISAIYRNELTAVLGAGKVAHAVSDKAPLLRVRIRRVDVRENMTQVQFKVAEGQWLDI